MSSSIPTSIPDTQLGLSTSEIHILRQHQQIALQSHQGHTAGGNSAGSTRGRGGVRGSPASSRNASVGSHHGGGGGGVGGQQGHQHQGRLVLDPGSLTVLGGHFERLMGAIQARVEQLTAQTQISTTAQSARAGETIASADAEIARFHEILRQIDELEVEFDKVRHIRDIVKGFRSRVEGLERKIDGRGGSGGGKR